MTKLSESGTQLIRTLSQRYGLSEDAAMHMLIAVHNGNGSMAQFNHPEFGGAGQWMRGGMTMVSDLFNNQLKYRVDSVCSDIANELNNHQLVAYSGSFQSQSQNGVHSQSQSAGGMGSANSLFVPDPASNWWPQDLGSPNAMGSQNNVRYAYFSGPRRLAVATGSSVWVYDTLDHQIGGFSQQQGIGGSITFTSQYGVVNLSTLPVVSRDGVPAQTTFAPPATANAPVETPAHVQPSSNVPVASFTSPQNDFQPGNAAATDVIGLLEKLGGLRDKGYISEEEFAAKKADLLKRL
jgi:hypothetical protein